MEPKTPKALLSEHENLFNYIENLVSLGGELGEEAKLLSEFSRPHFKKEEEYALPPLSLLLTLSEGNWTLESTVAIEMADKLKVTLSEMKKEHNIICKMLENLEVLAKKEDNQKLTQFINDLKLHIDVEEQVLYPATILTGDYLKNLKPKN